MEIISNSAYHAKKEYISSSMLKTMYSQSEQHLGTFQGNASTDFGTLAHAYILEREELDKTYAVMPEFKPQSKEMVKKYVKMNISGGMQEVDSNYGRTKEFREQKEAWEAKNPECVSLDDMDKLQRMSKNVRESEEYFTKYLTGGVAEGSVFVDNIRIQTEDKEFFIRGRVRFDYCKEINGVVYIIDYKTCQDASTWGFKSSVNKFKYKLQGAWYVDVAREFFGKEVRFVFLAQEIDE